MRHYKGLNHVSESEIKSSMNGTETIFKFIKTSKIEGSRANGHGWRPHDTSLKDQFGADTKNWRHIHQTTEFTHLITNSERFFDFRELKLVQTAFFLFLHTEHILVRPGTQNTNSIGFATRLSGQNQCSSLAVRKKRNGANVEEKNTTQSDIRELEKINCHDEGGRQGTKRNQKKRTEFGEKKQPRMAATDSQQEPSLGSLMRDQLRRAMIHNFGAQKGSKRGFIQ